MTTHADEAPLLPGLKPVLELLAAEPQRIDLVFCRKGLHSPEARELQNLCRRQGVRFSLVEAQALDRMCHSSREGRGGVAHQGCIARLAVTTFCGTDELWQHVSTAPLPLILALDQVQDPGNVGTLCRTLYALGGAGLILPKYNAAYLGPAARRSAAGALEHLPVAQVTNLARALDSAEEAGLTIYGAGMGGGGQDLDAFRHPMQLPAVLVLGNEEKGLRPGVAKRCAHMLHIPMCRDFDSLNVAQAGGILLALTAAARSTQA